MNSRLPSVVRIKKAVRGVLYGFEPEILDRLPLFQPWSAGSVEALEKLTILAANRTFPLLADLLAETGRERTALVTAGDFCAEGAARASSLELKRLFDKYGSDKAALHDYHLVYGTVLTRIPSIAKLLEIGLGSSNQDIVSNMGKEGRPGASLRAFRDYLPGVQVYGADVDARILFTEDRIRTFYVDQTDLASFNNLGQHVGDQLDLIIDDGLHSPNANLAVLLFARKRLTRGGWLIIEDIREDALPLWKVVAALLPAELKPYLIQAGHGAIVFAVERVA
jgi:SAM-dependent methyltransferase